jgi:hypothetical protein
MRRSSSSRRLLLLMPLAAWSVHQLRYFITYGAGAGRELSDQGHAYLTLLMPAIGGLAALAFGGFLLRFVRAWQGDSGDAAPKHGTRRLWAVIATGLLAIYVGQELVEGLLATGHAPGLAGVFGQGGWWAVLAALVVGLLLALALRGAEAVESLFARGKALGRRRPHTAGIRIPPSARLALQAPLARLGAGRAPPAINAIV